MQMHNRSSNIRKVFGEIQNINDVYPIQYSRLPIFKRLSKYNIIKFDLFDLNFIESLYFYFSFKKNYFT